MQRSDTSIALTRSIPAAPAPEASYSAGNLVRRALIGLLIIVAFTSAGAWLLHASTTAPATEVERPR